VCIKLPSAQFDPEEKREIDPACHSLDRDRSQRAVCIQTHSYKCDGTVVKVNGLHPLSNPHNVTKVFLGLQPYYCMTQCRTHCPRNDRRTQTVRVPATFPLHKHEAWACTFFLSSSQVWTRPPLRRPSVCSYLLLN